MRQQRQDEKNVEDNGFNKTEKLYFIQILKSVKVQGRGGVSKDRNQ